MSKLGSSPIFLNCITEPNSTTVQKVWKGDVYRALHFKIYTKCVHALTPWIYLKTQVMIKAHVNSTFYYETTRECLSIFS